uniref:Uncharacterized protein n=1 Tax=viral metagenome TaxID=1070528 RepID=A0A6C0B3L8_9ZZZZ
MNEFRLLFQIFLVFVLFSGIYVIFWVNKYSESFSEGLTDSPNQYSANNSVTGAPQPESKKDDAPSNANVPTGQDKDTNSVDDTSTDENTQGTDDANDSEPEQQNLDDYILNQNPVTLESTGNRENNVYSDDAGNTDFIKSTVAYPDSSYGPFDPLNEDINHYEYVAKEFVSSQPTGLSDNPMDPNWGGVKYTQDILKSGKYNDNNITKPLLFQPKGIYIDAIPSAFGKPEDKLENS